MRRGRRWLAAVVVATAAGWWTAGRPQACLLGTCDAMIVANQVVQIGHMVTQIGRMVEQLRSLDGVLDVTTELISSNDVGMGNIGRLREVMDARWWLDRDGSGLTTDASGEGAFSQRIPGVTDAAGWLSVLAAPEAGLLATRPATAVRAELPGAFDAWTLPDEGQSLAVLAALEEMGSGAGSYREVWDAIAATLPPLPTAADLAAVTADPAARAVLVESHERAQAVSSADLVHAHATAEAASLLAGQVGEAAAALADLRADDLMRTQRVDQAQLAAAVTGTELAVARAQLAAYEAARAARARYEAERARREALARWRADAVRARTRMEDFGTEVAAAAAARVASHRYTPSASAW